MVVHEAEDIIVDVAEEVYFGFDPPVVPVLSERRMLVEKPAVPSAHLVVGEQVRILHVLFLQQVGGFFEQIHVDPGRDCPVFFRDELVPDLGGGKGRGAHFEFFREGLVIEESPGIVEFGVERLFEVGHRLQEVVELGVADEGNDGGIDAVGIGIVRGVIVAFDAP